jgi:hypothetical protein
MGDSVSTYFIAVGFLVIALSGCGKHEVRETVPTAWESLAKGYKVEGSRPVLGRGRQIRKTEESTEGRLFDFSLSVGPVVGWSDAKAKVTHFWGWGAATDATNLLRQAEHVLEVSLILDGKPVHIPEAAYVDLIDLRSGTRPVWIHGSHFLLYLEGADAGESYRVRFMIENHRIVKREIWPGEFPELGPVVTTFKDGAGE